jgi:hypothetical protein
MTPMLMLVSGLLTLPISAVYWAFNLRVGQLLRERHPLVWDRYRRRTLAVSTAHSFAWRRLDDELDDEELSHNALWLRRVSVVVYFGLGAFVVGLLLQLGED